MMATAAPQNSALPIFYRDLVPLSSVDHATWRTRGLDSAPFLRDQHAIPLTVDEFSSAQRHYPIVFSSGNDPVPLALMGLNESVNTYVDEAGKITEQVYVPAYVRRYPFLLARIRPDAAEMSLCFDPTSGAIGAYDEGNMLFDDGQPTQEVQNILNFCEQFEQSGMKTAQFVTELAEHKLLMEGEVSIQPDGAAQPFIYRGFQMVDETKVRELRGDVLRKMNQSGMLPLIYAHLFSLSLISEIFNRQVRQNRVPELMQNTV